VRAVTLHCTLLLPTTCCFIFSTVIIESSPCEYRNGPTLQVVMFVLSSSHLNQSRGPFNSLCRDAIVIVSVLARAWHLIVVQALFASLYGSCTAVLTLLDLWSCSALHVKPITALADMAVMCVAPYTSLMPWLLQFC